MSVPKSASNDQSSLLRAGELKVELIDPRELIPSPYSATIYGNSVDPEFVELVRKNGITTAIECLPGKNVLSGGRRLAAALLLKFAWVPIIVRYDLVGADELEIQKLTILANAGRDKSRAVVDIEVAELLRIETEQAERRRNSKLKIGKSSRSTDSVERGPEVKGEAAVIVAKQVGRSPDTVRKIGQIHDEINRLKAEGNEEEAAAIEEKRKKSVDAAHKHVKERRARLGSRQSHRGRKTSTGKAGQEKQLKFLRLRVTDYQKTGQKERAAQLKKRMTQAVKGGRGRDLVPLPALFCSEKKLPRPTPFDLRIADIQSKLNCLSTCDASIAWFEELAPGVIIDVVTCGKAATVLIKGFTAALETFEKKAQEFRAANPSTGKPAPTK